jgi:hypothetical protein
MEKFNFKKQENIKQFAVNFNEYVNSIKKKPISEALLLKYVEQAPKEYLKIEATLTNYRISRQIKEFVIVGLAEELDQNKQQEQIDPYDDDFYISNLNDGYRLQAAPVYGENMDIISHRYTKAPLNTTPEQQKLANDINIKYEKEYNNKFYYEQEAKEALLTEKVTNGEMVFIGEMSFDDYIELRKTNPISGKNFELIPCFDDKKEWWTENRKVYGYVNNENLSSIKEKEDIN